MKKFLQILSVLGILAFAGCSESVEPKPLQYHKIFTGETKKTWRVSSIVWTGEGHDDLNATLSSCLKDDLYVFYSNAERLFEVTNGATKCDSSEPDKLLSDEWSFVNATATLTFIMPLLSDSSLPFYVKKMTSKEMVLEIYIDQDSKYSYKITFQSVSEE